MPNAVRPRMSVVIPTRSRPCDIECCLESLTDVDYPHWSLLIMDQSDDDYRRTKAVVDSFAGRLSQLTYVRVPEQGSARARNKALQLVDGDIVAFLDDDCTVEPDWLDTVAATFARHPTTALVFGTVKAAFYDPADSFIPCYLIKEEHVLRGRLASARTRGMGASMYVRRSLWDAVGPIDTYFGAGAKFAGEDRDLSYRVLASGHTIVETPSIVVQHYGIRAFKDGGVDRTLRRYAYSDAALHAKILRCGDLTALALITMKLAEYFSHINWGNLLRGRRPTHLLQPMMYLRGLRATTHFDVDRRRYLLLARNNNGRPDNGDRASRRERLLHLLHAR